LDEFADGDDTVTTDSLILPGRWNRKNIVLKEFEGSHLMTLFNIKVLAYIHDIIKNDKLLIN
jgi:hypothetical protein